MALKNKVESGMIIMKCHGCKTPTLFKLNVWQDGEDTVNTANRHCQSCEEDLNDPLESIVEQTVEPALVDAQRIDFGCHVPNRGDSSE